MTAGIGIVLAFVAMLAWGFGDFLIQKSTRKVGDWETLFLITLFGVIVLLPFVWARLPALLTIGGNDLVIIGIACAVLFMAALLDFEALRRGKLAIVEPIWSFEVPVAAILAFTLIGERISATQIVLIATLIICLVLIGLKQKTLEASFFLEKGVILAILGAIFMGAANFFMGWGGRVSDPVMINFLSDAFIAILCAAYLVSHGKLRRTFADLKRNFAVILPMSVSDKIAWLAFVFSMSLVSIAVATAISESYIIIAVLMGLVVNREKLHAHQKVGLVGAIITAIILAAVTAG